MKTKIVNYRNGLVLFEIPDNWVEEIGETNGGTFYEDSQDSSTLRLDVLTFQNSSGNNSQMINELISNSGYELFRGTLAIRKRVQRTEENGEKISIFYWDVGAAFGVNKINVFCFSYTILTDQESDDKFISELKFIENSIKSAEYVCST